MGRLERTKEAKSSKVQSRRPIALFRVRHTPLFPFVPVHSPCPSRRLLTFVSWESTIRRTQLYKDWPFCTHQRSLPTYLPLALQSFKHRLLVFSLLHLLRPLTFFLSLHFTVLRLIYLITRYILSVSFTHLVTNPTHILVATSIFHKHTHIHTDNVKFRDTLVRVATTHGPTRPSPQPDNNRTNRPTSITSNRHRQPQTQRHLQRYTPFPSLSVLKTRTPPSLHLPHLSLYSLKKNTVLPLHFFHALNAFFFTSTFWLRL